MIRNLSIVFILVILVSGFSSLAEYKFHYPKNWPKPDYDFSKNKLSEDKIYLGRVLFYDPILSKDSSISCASCHSPFNAFAHTDHDLSHGINDRIGIRNAPALFNLAWHQVFMWDGAINHLDVQALAPIHHKDEMDENLDNVVGKLNRSKFYQKLFKKAFKENQIDGEKILKALAQFQLTLISAESKYDSVKRGQAFFTEKERKGYELFKTHCNSCHVEPLFSNFKFANNGLAVDTSLNDPGRMKTTLDPVDSLYFKIPSLRNLSYTYPYMHDGRFKKLSQVINHYVDGIIGYSNLSDELKKPIRLNSNEKVELIAFLLTLNDRQFVFNKNYGFPKNILK